MVVLERGRNGSVIEENTVLERREESVRREEGGRLSGRVNRESVYWPTSQHPTWCSVYLIVIATLCTWCHAHPYI